MSNDKIEPLSVEEIAHIKHLHRVDVSGDYCWMCVNATYPCHARKLIATIEARDAEIAKLNEALDKHYLERGCAELKREIARKDEALHQILNESTICGSDFGNFRVAALAEAALRPKAPRIVQGGDCWQVATPTCQVLVRNFEPPACGAPVVPGTDRCEKHTLTKGE